MNRSEVITTLNHLLRHYDSSRRAGHTTTMLNGVENGGTNRPIVITHNVDFGRWIKNNVSLSKRDNFDCMSLAQISTSGRGLSAQNGKPLAWDNAALFSLFSDILRAMDEERVEAVFDIEQPDSTSCSG